MWLVNRRKYESIVIGENLSVTVVEVLSDKVRIGIDTLDETQVTANPRDRPPALSASAEAKHVYLTDRMAITKPAAISNS